MQSQHKRGEYRQFLLEEPRDWRRWAGRMERHADLGKNRERKRWNMKLYSVCRELHVSEKSGKSKERAII